MYIEISLSQKFENINMNLPFGNFMKSCNCNNIVMSNILYCTPMHYVFTPQDKIKSKTE